MSQLSVGDLASTFQLRRFTSGAKSDLARLSLELTTGVKSDLGAAIGGDFGPLAGIERRLRSADAYTQSSIEARGLLSASQSSLESVQSITADLIPALLTASSARDSTLIATTAEDSRQKFASVVNRLNTQVADRSLFAGAASDARALASPETMLADLVAASAGLTTAADVETAVEAWFDDVGGGFETLGYSGSTDNLGALIVGDGELVELDVRADDQALRDLMKSYALGALVAENVLAGDDAERAALLERAAGRMMAANDDVTLLRARIGSVEATVEAAEARNMAERSAYELARNDLVAADPYETATLLETTYAKLETLYTITARLSALRFSDYMR